MINKSKFTFISLVTLKNFAAASTAQVYQYSGSDLGKIIHQPDLAITSSRFTGNFPANSITLLVFSQK
jgi:hypothetical protein